MTVILKARKRHRCDLCGLHIEVGEPYEREPVFGEGTVYAFKNHPDCMKLVLAMDMTKDEPDGVDCNLFADIVCSEWQDHNAATSAPIPFREMLLQVKALHFPVYMPRLKYT